jgi:hypothetical protein
VNQSFARWHHSDQNNEEQDCRIATCHNDNVARCNGETYGHVYLVHVSAWPRVSNPRGHMATCNKYSCLYGHMYL